MYVFICRYIYQYIYIILGSPCHPGGNPGANLKSISHRCFLVELAFVWELTKDTIVLPLGCLQSGCVVSARATPRRDDVGR